MSWQTNPYFDFVRSTTRVLGINRIVGSLMARGGYERAFDEAMFAELRQDDTIWDVGANIGFYTRKYSEVVGDAGTVIAFEPFPETFQRLSAEVINCENVTLINAGLGSVTGKLSMMDGGDDIGANSRIVDDVSSNAVAVQIHSAVDAVREFKLAIPNVVKIDTEGFEFDVLQGMSQILPEPNLRALFVEVHFSLLEKRGMSHAPRKIEALLKENSFEIKWVDPSHLVALRR